MGIASFDSLLPSVHCCLASAMARKSLLLAQGYCSLLFFAIQVVTKGRMYVGLAQELEPLLTLSRPFLLVTPLQDRAKAQKKLADKNKGNKDTGVSFKARQGTSSLSVPARLPLRGRQTSRRSFCAPY